jgi:Mg2+ and Co2+ transporter CorA
MSDQQTVTTSPPPNTVTVTDAKGRVLTIRKLNAFDRMKLFQAAGPELSENSSWIAYALCAASVTATNGTLEPFPGSLRAIENMVKFLDDDGITAVSKAYKENFTAGENGNLEEIKN